ncbi:MAG: sigma-54-dependent Fis family transcriptional regulator [Bdellovibrio sp.]|nr:sigma-54-dependent Fis family transcriptional regulator [Bdellovibrio sp.]
MVQGVQGRVLVIDDEKNITFVIQAILDRAGYETLIFNDSAEAMDSIGTDDVDLIITDLYMPGPGGMEILEFCQNNYPQLPVVIITAYGTVESAVNALKRGAFDFITKPFEQSELLTIVKKAVATHQQRQKEPITLVSSQRPAPVSNSAQPAAEISSIIGNSSQMQEIFKVISKIASSPSTVLVWGESGTGKELVAFEIHRNSNRANKPFIKINCAAIPATLIESELFGFERGAFTGAVASKPGRFELAHEGTLFLDEVAEMPPEMQVKLLRVLQEQEFERVGGVNTIQVDVRIITASNKDLEAEVKAGRFREDLFYRLNVVPIHLPALRERKEDIELLVKYFLTQFNEKLRKSVTAIMPETLNALKNHPWPGNIRQLENALERMILMCEGSVLTLADLPEEIQPVAMPGAEEEGSEGFKAIVRRQTQNLERELIEKALEETGGNVTRAAEKLGLSRKGLQLKIKELGLIRR